MRPSIALAHSHTHSMRTTDGAEVLVVRVLTRERVAGYGFTFREDVAAARAMACWDAAARAAGRPLWQLLREAGAPALAPFEADADDWPHPWTTAWQATLAAARGAREAASEAEIDWTLEPAFATLRWIEPDPEPQHGKATR